jgi:AraC-like DNA-binding protein
VYFAESEHAQDFEMPPRADPYHKLLYVLRGRVSYREQGREAETVRAGMLVWVPARVRHALVDEVPSTLLLLCASERFLRGEADLAAEVGRRRGLARRAIAVGTAARGGFEKLWRTALLETAHPRAAGDAARRALALQVWVQVARLPELDGDDDAAARVAAVGRALEESFHETWTLDAAAERAGMSRRHFSAHFRAATGRTFWEHLTEVRLAHAAKLLAGGAPSIAGVLFACGFGDVSQFYRLFRGRFGKPPGEFRSRAGARAAAISRNT